MNTPRILLLLFIVGFISANAQVMNVRKWRKTERDSLDKGLQMVDDNYFAQAMPIFQNLLSNHPDEIFLKYSYAKCALYRPDKHAEAYQNLKDVYAKNKKLPGVHYDLALAAHYNYQFDEADTYVDLFGRNRRISPEERGKAEILKKNIAYARYYSARPTKAKISNLGPAVNSEGEEYVPAITADESKLIFTYAGKKSMGGLQNAYLQEDLETGVYMEDIYLASRKNGQFSQAVPLDSLNTTGPDAAISLSNDGSILFVYQDLDDGHGDIYQSFLIGNNFSKPQKLRGRVNSYSWDGHCSLSPDGKTLYFSSERSEGFGGRDIYRASLAADSSWTNVVNLGDSVNTPLDDDAPFIHADGKTLFYSSKGRTSMGGYDIFKAVMNSDSSFKKVEHLGFPINSPSDDIFFVPAANGKSAYYSSARKEGLGMKDIYRVEPEFENAPALVLVKGKVMLEGRPAEASVEVSIPARNRLFNVVYANAVSGDYLVCLPAGEDYLLRFNKDVFKTQEKHIKASDLTVYNEQVVDINFEVPKKDTVPAALPLAKKTEYVVKPDADGFMPLTKLHEKSMRYREKFGDNVSPDLVFMVQITALKNTGKYYFPKLARYGRIEKLDLGDGYTRLVIGGGFKTLRKAFEFNKKIIRAGQKDAFVIALYKGKRVQFEELERLGVFK